MFDFENSSAAKIKAFIKEVKIEDYPGYVEILKKDERKAVVSLSSSMKKKYEKYMAEVNRIETIKKAEDPFYEQGAKYIVGIDEVGRGPLAGPVVTAAVVMPRDSKIMYVNDSKKLNKKKREELAEIIKKEAISYSLGIKDNRDIDRENILNATKSAMLEAVESLSVKPDILLIDAVNLDTNIKQEAFIKGDERVYSIAAASIIAKVHRDNLMEEYGKKYPEYGFENNMGYGTYEHTMAIKDIGLCPIHRRSFTANFVTGRSYDLGTAYKTIKEKGYTVLEYDYKDGLVDIVAKVNDTYAFIHVGETISEETKENMIKGAKTYLKENNVKNGYCRFDKVSVKNDKGSLIENAFTL